MAIDLAGLVKSEASIQDIATHLDGLSSEARVNQCLGLPGRLEARLFETAKHAFSINLETLTPEAEETVIYALKNSLPVFNVSEKRFYRPTEGEVVGYNHTSPFVTRWAGPGYFFAMNGDDGELVFDYTRLPTFQPLGWPKIRPNEGLIAKMTYGDMTDYVRAIGQHTLIGAAYRHGKPMKAHFLLTRVSPT